MIIVKKPAPTVAAVRIVALLDPAKITPSVLGAIARMTGTRKRFVSKVADTTNVANSCIGEYEPEDIANGYRACVHDLCLEEPATFQPAACHPEDVARIVYALDPAVFGNLSTSKVSKIIGARVSKKNFSAIKTVVDYSFKRNFANSAEAAGAFTDLRLDLTKTIEEPDLRQVSKDEPLERI